MKTALVIKLYGDIPVGTVGDIIKTHKDKNNNTWIKLHFGKNLTGQNLRRTIPADCLKIEK